MTTTISNSTRVNPLCLFFRYDFMGDSVTVGYEAGKEFEGKSVKCIARRDVSTDD